MPSDELVRKLVDKLVPSKVKSPADPTPLGTDLDDDEPVILGQKVDKVLWALGAVDSVRGASVVGAFAEVVPQGNRSVAGCGILNERSGYQQPAQRDGPEGWRHHGWRSLFYQLPNCIRAVECGRLTSGSPVNDSYVL